MHFISTRNSNLRKTLSEAIRCGLAEDGGLFVPEYFPKIDINELTPDLNFAQTAEKILKPFFINDVLDTHFEQICSKAFNFPISLKPINHHTFMLELFHGPTLSFKDFGARFLAETLNTLSDKMKTTIMVATSGDTGSAVASAFMQNLTLMSLFSTPKVKFQKDRHIKLLAGIKTS